MAGTTNFVTFFSHFGNTVNDFSNAYKTLTDPNATALEKFNAADTMGAYAISFGKLLSQQLGPAASVTALTTSIALFTAGADTYYKNPTTVNLDKLIQVAGGLIASLGPLAEALGEISANPEISLLGIGLVTLGNAITAADVNRTAIANSVWIAYQSASELASNWLGISIQAMSSSTPVNATVASGGAMPTGTGMIIPSQTPDSSASYQLLDNGNGTFSLLFSNGINFNYSSTLQQWFIPDANGDGGSIVYSRDINAGISYGEWTVQQIDASGTVTSTANLSGNIPGESLTIATGSGSNPFITGKGETTAIPTGMSTAEAMAYFEATGTQVSFSDLTATSQGNAQTFTIYASAASTAQTITLALSGGTGTYDILDMNTGKTFSLSGPVTLLIPAGQDSATYTLIDTSNAGTAGAATLTATMTDANGTVTSNNLTVNFNDTAPAASSAADTISGQFGNDITVTGFSLDDAANDGEWRMAA